MKTTLALLVGALVALNAHAAPDISDYVICVSNEKSGDISVIDGKSLALVDNIAVGKRPRGIHAGPEGKYVYVALSGTRLAARRSWTKTALPFLKRTTTKTPTIPRTALESSTCRKKR